MATSSDKQKRELLKHHTVEYDPQVAYAEYGPLRDRPLFRRWYHVPLMMREPRLCLAMWVIKGTLLSKTRFYVNEGSEQPSKIKEFVVRQISRWWRNSAVKQLSAMDWGYYCAEPLYRVTEEDLLEFDSFKSFRSRDCTPVTKEGARVGHVMRNVRGKSDKFYLGVPKSFWHIHSREHNQWYGRSRYFGAYEPWLDLWDEGGLNDIQRLYYYKYVYQGEKYYYPPGSSPTTGGALRPNKDIMRDIAEKRRTGAPAFLPSSINATTGEREWNIEPMAQFNAGAELAERHAQLKNDLIEGVGVPEEMIRAAETGSGYSGRAVPQQAYHGMLYDIAFWMISDFDEQVLRPILLLNFGIKEPSYEIEPFGLISDEEQEQESDENERSENKPGGHSLALVV